MSLFVKCLTVCTILTCKPASAGTLFEEQFISRFVEPIVAGQPLDLTELAPFPENGSGQREYANLSPRFVTSIVDDHQLRMAISNGFYFSDENHDQQDDYKHWTISDKSEIDSAIASFENWVAAHPAMQDAAACTANVTANWPTTLETEILYEKAVSFSTPDQNPGLFYLVIHKTPAVTAYPNGDYLILVNAMVGTNTTIPCIP